MNYIPGGRMIKKYILRIIGGILFLPVGPILLFWNESKAIQHIPVYEGAEGEWRYWVLRLLGFLFTWFCLYRIISAIKLFMMKIPLSYKEIRAGIYISSLLGGLILSLICLSISWLLSYPVIGIVLGAVAIALMFVLLIRRKQQRKLQMHEVPSAKPHQARDV